MSISFGSNSMKPYVGDKEVQEAYVGSQLVYRATPPYVYAFLGTESDYYLATWAQLLTGAAIVQEGGIYRISTGTATGGTLAMTQIPTKKIKFVAKSATQTNALKLQGLVGGRWYDVKQFVINAAYELQEADIPENAEQIRLRLTLTTFNPIYLDAIRFEET